MPNSIAFAKNYTTILDEVYQLAATSTVLNSPASLARAGSNAREIIIPKVSVTGLGDYDRNAGYTDASVTFEWETRTFNYDRGAKITVDAMDAEESGLVNAFTAAGTEFQRLRVAPEADAFTYAQIAGHDGISKVAAGVTYADGTELLEALLAVTSELDEKEVPREGRMLFITPTLRNSVKALDTTKSREALGDFSKVVEVPQSRFYTAIELLDGKTSGEEAGHFKVATNGKPINFMVIEKSAVIKFDKHVASRIFSPDELENLDAHMSKYRKYGIVDVFDNKAAGIYLSHKA